ncbi:hypothetical protein SEVIR_3G370500v4 [Setaria viridis]|uniref:F-box domain-containing protein n=2 Tax=Setaria viridis TaxID=4556 RepID=A0A4U6VLE3_SETVI|nr:hypothetical protein SEVIR_3G370500v2 [Setaria viridis]
MAPAALLRKRKLDGDAPPAVAATNDGQLLPRDMLREVLLRLRAAELCRLRLVCRSWRSLTSDPGFAAAHASRHPPHLAALHSDTGEAHVLDLAGGIVKRVRVYQLGIDRSNDFHLDCVYGCWWQAFVLGVPVGEIAADIAYEEEIRYGKDVPKYVLGHVPSTGEYKVLAINFSLELEGEGDIYQGWCLARPVMTCDVMTLGSGSDRRRVRPGPPVHVAFALWHRTVVDGVAYFLIDGCDDRIVDPDCIASFDMAAEEWRPMTLHGPQISLLGSTSTKERMHYIRHAEGFWLAGLNGSLVAVHRNDRDWSMDLWELVDMERSLWTKQYSMPRIPFWDSYGFVCPLVVLDDGRIVFWMHNAGVITAYDPKISSWDYLFGVGQYYDVTMHQGSLLCSHRPLG